MLGNFSYTDPTKLYLGDDSLKSLNAELPKYRKNGLSAMESRMKELGLAMNLREIGATEDVIEDIVNTTLILDGGYKVFTKKDLRKVIEASM